MDEIIRYLKANIFGKTLHTDELTYTLENHTLEGIYSDQIIFSNPMISDYGFNFDMFLTANETVYELDERKQRAYIRGNHNGISVFRYELAKRKSTGEITGIFRLITTTNQNQTAQAVVCGVFGVELKGGQLRWFERQVLYRDQSSSGGEYHPVAFDSRNRLYTENGKAIFEYDGTCYDIDAKTHAKSLSKDIFPRFIAKEKPTKSKQI